MSGPFAAIEAWFLRRTARFESRGAARAAMLLVPLLFGVISLLLGQDDNWDLRNYHWYNPYAYLNGRLDVDLAPGQWQSYFNPTIDLPYYLLSLWLAPPVIGFLYGALHGLNFLLVLSIARQLVGGGRLALLLALAGMCGVAFLSEIGNTMGDNMTSLLVLASLNVVLRFWERIGKGAVYVLLAAGLLMGLGTGLKLTNVSFAVGLCLALLFVPMSLLGRLRAAMAFGLGVVLGIGITAGHWFLEMFQRFMNPVFPQFNDLFRSPMAQAVGVIDNYHLPQSFGEALLWPFVFTANFNRVSELVLRQMIWPVLYTAAIAVCAWCLYQRARGRPSGAPFTPRARLVLVFFAVAYLVWMKLFSIYRYLVPVELLAPLLVWLLLQRIAAPPRVAGWALALCCLWVFPFTTWGHAPWADKSFSATVPALADPGQTVIFTAHGHPPMGWLAPAMPKEARVIALAGGFPESPLWLADVERAVAARTGPHYVMLGASKNPKEAGRRRKQAIADALGWTGSAAGCARLRSLLGKGRFGVRVQDLDGARCAVALEQRFDMDLAAQDRAVVAEAASRLARYGLRVHASACKTFPAAVGGEPYPYLLCVVTREI